MVEWYGVFTISWQDWSIWSIHYDIMTWLINRSIHYDTMTWLINMEFLLWYHDMIDQYGVFADIMTWFSGVCIVHFLCVLITCSTFVLCILVFVFCLFWCSWHCFILSLIPFLLLLIQFFRNNLYSILNQNIHLKNEFKLTITDYYEHLKLLQLNM